MSGRASAAPTLDLVESMVEAKGRGGHVHQQRLESIAIDKDEVGSVGLPARLGILRAAASVDKKMVEKESSSKQARGVTFEGEIPVELSTMCKDEMNGIADGPVCGACSQMRWADMDENIECTRCANFRC